jgi:hypothetical protein
MESVSNDKDRVVVNDNLRRFADPMKKRHLNSVAINSGNTFQHELMKFKVAYDLVKEGRTIATELFLLNGARPDVIVLDLPTPMVYEIIQSESEEHAIKKTDRYYGMKIQVVRA